MSRKRSEEAIQSHHRRFVEGAMRLHGVDAETAERVFAKVKGFSGFGFPKSHAGSLRVAGGSVDLAAGALRAGVPVRTAERTADGLLPAGCALARGDAEGDEGGCPGRQLL